MLNKRHQTCMLDVPNTVNIHTKEKWSKGHFSVTELPEPLQLRHDHHLPTAQKSLEARVKTKMSSWSNDEESHIT